jgi:micrococcal nuclease
MEHEHIKEDCLYLYKAHCTSVYDGDTITVTLDLGFGLRMEKVKLRLAGIDTPEMRRPELEEARRVRDWLRDKILDKDIYVLTIQDKKGKYGRFLAHVYYNINDLVSINETMLAEGLAKPY